MIDPLTSGNLMVYSRHALFVVWSDALPLVDSIRADLAKECTILADVRVEWSEPNRFDNLRRFYQQALQDGKKTTFQPEKMSGNTLHVFYVENACAELVLHRSASGEIEQVLDVFITCKQKFRRLAEQNYGYPYLVHCAATPQELRLQTTLLFGSAIGTRLAQGDRLTADTVKKDIVGADGWVSLAEAFEALSGAVDWCVMRGWNTLPEAVDGDDLDILVSSKKAAFSALGLTRPKGPDGIRNGYLSLVSGERIKFDLHWIGDGYFDPFWQSEVLRTRQSQNGYFRPSPTHALMIAIYSEIVLRPIAREKQMERIRDLANSVAHSGWLTDEALAHRQSLIEILRGFMISSKYVTTKPLVRRHHLAGDALKILSYNDETWQNDSVRKFKAITTRTARSLLPARIRAVLLSIYRKRYRNVFK